MRKELEDRIVAACPNIYRNSKPRFEDVRFECGDGWYQLIMEISQILEAESLRGRQPITVGIVKEKFGGLRFGYSGTVPGAVHDAAAAIERRSTITCEKCGQPGERQTRNNWITTLCPACAKALEAGRQ